MYKYLMGLLYYFLFYIPCVFAEGLPFMVGTSQAVVSPSPGAYIAGHTLNRKFSGRHDDLYAKAIVISDGSTALALITVDCIGLLYPQLQQVRERVAASLSELELPASHIILTSTHTHAGPDVVGLWGPERMISGVDTVYLSSLVRTCAGQVIKAYRYRQPANARYAEATFGTEWVYNISQPDELDRTLTVLQFTDVLGKSIATLTNFACHPTIVDAVHDKVSADYVGGFYEKMDRTLEGMNMFLQGAIGGWIQPEYEAKTFEQAYFRGYQLADTVRSMLLLAQPLRGDRLHFRSKAFTMPVDNFGFRMMASAGVVKRPMAEGTQTEIAWFSLGDAQFATHPGETVPAMSWSTRKMMKNYGPKFILGLGMDAMGYIVKPEFFDPQKKIPHAEYLCSMSVGAHAMPLILEVLRELIPDSPQ